MTVYYFIKYFSDQFEHYFKKINDTKAIITFDLEDSIMHPNQSDITIKLKEKARKVLTQVITPTVAESPLAIRVNPVHSEEFIKDLDCLASLKKKICWDKIMLPKIGSTADLDLATSLLNQYQIAYKSLGIFIETKEGMEQLENILSSHHKVFDTIIFGHADYNYDTHTFPIIDHCHQNYWEWIKQLDRLLGTYAITLINSPVLYLNNTELFKANLQKLAETCIKSPYGQMTLNHAQTKSCFEKSSINSYPLIRKIDKHPLIHAKEVIESYEQQKTDKSFSIQNDGYLISPHEYRLAKQFQQKEQQK